MIFETKPIFLISRDGYILSTDEIETVLGTYMKIGPRGMSMPDAYYFPIGTNSDIVTYRLRNYHRLCRLSSFVKIIGDNLTKTRSKREIERMNKVIARVKTCANDIAARMKVEECPTDLFAKLTDQGQIEAGMIEYKTNGNVIYGVPDVEITVKYERLHVGLGTEWVCTLKQEDADSLQAAMRATVTKEQLLDLLISCGAIKSGEWLTIDEFANKKNLREVFKAVDDMITQDTEAMMDSSKPKGVY